MPIGAQNKQQKTTKYLQSKKTPFPSPSKNPNRIHPAQPFHPLSPCPDRVYIAWLSLVTLAFNYNIWFSTARLCFPYHTAEAIPYWFLLDSLADLVYLVDCLLFQPRKQFVKGGDVIVSEGSEPGGNRK